MKCILQNSASVFEYMTVVELHAISVCYVDMWSKASVLWTWFCDTDIAFRFFQLDNDKMALKLFVCLR
jgi:hypothetical protein